MGVVNKVGASGKEEEEEKEEEGEKEEEEEKEEVGEKEVEGAELLGAAWLKVDEVRGPEITSGSKAGLNGDSIAENWN